ncbi:MAG: Fic family protein [Anaerolineaceae bacterium]|nr:Fic family protein [Anaerolineaceae bacterium]
MHRDATGQYRVTHYDEEQVRAFVPYPLPPNPPLKLDGSLQQMLEAASLALGRLDGVKTLLPNPALFTYFYVRKEALLSSQIEGTQSSLSDLLLSELGEKPKKPLDDVVEVSNYVAALQHGLHRMQQDGFPLCNRLIREVHEKLLSSGRGSRKLPGEFRRSQNWIGGSRPGNALYVPPPHTEVQDCMANLEKFMHAKNDGISMLIRAGMAHVQFETIHPFLDGNGRVGRLLITLMLCEAKILSEPLLYLSLYLKQNRNEYYELLQKVRETGDWESWIRFFLEGIRSAAEVAVDTANKLLDLAKLDRDTIEKSDRRVNSMLRVFEVLNERIIISISEASKSTGLAFATVSNCMNELVNLGIVSEYTGKSRGRLFTYDKYLALLSEGTEPL